MSFDQFFLWAKGVVQSFGYLGIFFINFIGSSSIIFPIPIAILVFIFGKIFNPFLVAISASVGCTLGELTGYGLGSGGKLILKKKYGKYLELGEKWFKRGQGFLTIMLFAATPLPDDVLGILGGIFNYGIKKFVLASFIGKMIMNLVLAFGGFYGIDWISNIFKLSL